MEHRVGAETYLLTFVPLRDLHYVNVYGKDITQRKKVEDALRQSEERFRLLTENASDIVIVLDAGGTISYASPSVRQVGGYAPEELIGRNAIELTHPDDLSLVTNALSTVAAHPEDRVTLEVRLRHKSGEWLNFDVIGINLVKEPAVRGFVVNARNITDRKRAEEALRENEDQYRNLVENSIDAVLLTAPDGSIYAANREACRIFGMTEEELIRAGRDGVMDPSDPRLRSCLEERARKGQFRGELRFRRKDGTVFPVEISSALYTDRDGNARTTMIVRDITGRKRAEEALRRRAEDLARKSAEVEAARDEAHMYLDILTHDVRNANNVSGMYADLLTELADGDLKTYAEKLQGSIERSNDILRSVATVRRIHEEETGLVPVNLDAVIRNEIGRFPEASIDYPDPQIEVLADGLLPTVFINLIGNAVKFGGPDVRITIRVEVQDREVLVSVEDTGPGIPDEIKQRLFARFERGMGRGSGEGLGLFICRMLVERYGGWIRVEDRVPGAPDAGAAFRFTLKRAA
ncbi:sensor histidine kinase [Methanoculleus horonobensis]|uniref:sensor histidine kinase n=1 Tax=Methanoculleus horonobensis TaxID=528314 RepID=UPI0008313338|nr:PAS domain-containing sensor histidine kinase [Methanoculleus horonobensis]MDD3070086.1 PAS domain-containing sensor histidine kinase [Methanoculleus horonobensis]